jgi:hypothetical protein
MARGGAYENPDVNVGIDRQSGQMIGQAIAGIGQQIGAAAANASNKMLKAKQDLAERKRKEAEQARIKAEQNWRIHKEVESQRTQTVINFDNTLKSNNIDMESLNGSFKTVIDDLYNAKDRLAQSRGDYEGRKEDEAMIRNNTAFIQGLGENFENMQLLTSTWKEKFKLRNTPGGIDDSATDPLFAAMMNIGEGNGQGINGGSVGWESRTGPGGKVQLYQVARSEKIRQLNWENGGKVGKLEDASDVYELSYDQVSGFLNDDDNNPNTFGPYSLVPDGGSERSKDLKGLRVTADGGGITQPDENGNGGYMSKGTEYEQTDGRGTYMEQKTWPDTKKIKSAIGPTAKSSAQAELGLGGSSITANSNIRANAQSRVGEIVDGKFVIKKDGSVTQYYFTDVGDGTRNGEGQFITQNEVVLGDSVNGLMTQENETGTEETDGYSAEEHARYIQFTEYQYMQQAGAYANPTTITPEAKDYIKTTTENSAEVAENYYKGIVDDPVARWNAIIPEADAEMKDGILTSGDDEFNFNKNEDGSYVDPVSVEKFVRELVLNDSTIGNTKEDRAFVKQIIDSIGIDVEEEVVLTEEQELEVGKNYSLIQGKINNILPSFEGSSSLDSIGGRTKLKKDVENIVKNAIPLLQQRDKSIKTEQQVVERLIKLSSKKGTSNYNPKLVKALNIYMQLTEQE